MNTNLDMVNIISLSATIGLGVLSIGIGGFAIWLSKRFEERASGALEAIRDLARETRLLVDVAVGQQRDFSTKMLDSILSRDPYGPSNQSMNNDQSSIEGLVKKQLAETEQRIGGTIEQAIRKLPGQTDPIKLEQAIASVREGISRLTDMAAARAASPSPIPKEFIPIFKKWQEFPAHFVLLYAIAKENCRSIEDVNGITDRYSFPSPFESGLVNLFEEKVLIGTLDRFEISPTLRELLPPWLQANREIIDELQNIYRKSKKKTEMIDDVQKVLGSKIKI